jgi:hypothetical protein
MPRVEPTIGSFDLDYDDPSGDAARAAAKVRRTRRAFKAWSVTLLLFAVLFAVCYGAAWYGDVLPEQFKPGAPQLFARVLVIAGFAIVLGAQLIGSLALFGYGFVRGALALLVPGYVLIGLKRSGIYWQVMGPWCAGILMVVAGTLLLS